MITVYTTLFGDLRRDRLQPPPAGCDARYVCFTDASSVPAGWTLERVASQGRAPGFLARLFKARPDRWFGDTTTIWVDASCELVRPAAELLAASPAPIVGMRHPDRSSVDAEAAIVVHQGLAPALAVHAQLAHYRAAGFTTSGPALTTTGLLVRRPSAAAFNRLWEDQLIRYQLRDQLSIDFCAWATRTPLAHLEGSYRDSAYMRYHRHARLAS